MDSQNQRKYLDIMTSVLSQAMGVKIISGDTWRADIIKKTIEYDNKEADIYPHELIKGLLIHEIGHINYTENTPITPLQKKHPEVMQNIYNVLEDLRIEYKLCDEYNEFAEIPLSNLVNYYLSLFLNNASPSNAQRPKLGQFLKLFIDDGYTSLYNTASEIIGYHAYNLIDNNLYMFDKEVIERYQTNFRELNSILSDTRYCSSVKEVKDIADTRLYPIIKDYIEEAQKIANIGEKLQEMLEKLKKGLVKKMAQTKLTHEIVKEVNITEAQAKLLLRNLVTTLAYRIRDILKERQAIHYTGNKKMGKLLSKNAYKVLTDESKIFSRKCLPEKPTNYTFTMLLDSSGSMREGDKLYNAKMSGYLIKFLAEELKLPCKMYSFGDGFKEINNLEDYKALDDFTEDSELLTHLLKGLKQDNLTNNIIFQITDGMIRSVTSDNRKFKIQELEKLSIFTTLILDDCNKLKTMISRSNSYRPSSYIEFIEKPENLPQAIIRLLSQAIER